MAKTFDFNSFKRPTMPVVLPGSKPKKTLTLIMPETEWVEALKNDLPEYTAVLSKGDTESVNACYTFAAYALSSNAEGFEVTADDLKQKYKVRMDALLEFMRAYLGFIEELEGAKN